MAFFTTNDFNRLDWQLLQNGCITLYWRLEILNQDLRWLEENKYKIDSFDCSTMKDKRALLIAIGDRLQFSDFHGNSLDALNDFLGDLDFSDSTGRVLVFRHIDHFSKTMPDIVRALFDVFAENARYFLLFGRRLIVLIQADDPKATFDPVGAQPILWNQKESLITRRIQE